VDHALTTTAFTLDGYKIARNLGVVRGIMARFKHSSAATSRSSRVFVKRRGAKRSN